MTAYRNRIIKFIIQVLIIFCISFFIRKETKIVSTISVALNNGLENPLEIEEIQKNQKELYIENKPKVGDPLYTFVGELTGYVGDCPLCSGYLACPPRTNVLKKGIYYNDKKYGKIRIVASSRNYPCGTILKFNVKKLSSEPIIAIVLDRGVGGNVIDLLSDSKDYAVKKIGRVRNLNFEVLREGWKE